MPTQAMTPTATDAPPAPPDGPAISLGGSRSGSLQTAMGETAAADIMAKLSKAGSVAPKGAPAANVGAAQPPAATPTPPAPLPTPPQPAPAPKPAPAAPAAAAPVAAPAATPAAAEPLKPDAPAAKETPKQLREAYERAQSKVTELETSVGASTRERAEALTKLAKAEEALTATQKRITEELEPLRKVHEEQSKRLQEREEALRIRDYTATDHWHQNYVKPIAETRQEALQFISELVVPDATGKEVPATEEHLNFVLSAATGNEAARRATQLFGDNSPFTAQLVNYRVRLRALAAKQQDALGKAQLESAEYFKAQQVQQASNMEKLRAAVAVREAEHLRGYTPGEDPELQGALAEGKALADRLVDGAEGMTLDGWADTVGRARAELQGASLLRKQNARLKAANEALEAELTRYRTSEPAVETRNEPRPAPGSAPITDTSSLIADVAGKLRARAMRP